MALTDIYNLPGNLCLASAPATASSRRESNTMTVHPDNTNSLTGTNSVYVGFYSEYYTFQAQKRARRRYHPDQSVYSGKTASEIWTEWDSWSDFTTVQSGAAATTKSGNRITLNEQLSIPHYPTTISGSVYDAIEIEVRVRVFNEPDGAFSEWVSKTFRPKFSHDFTIGSSVIREDGSVLISGISIIPSATPWKRECDFSIGAILDDSGVKVGEHSSKYQLNGGGGSVEVPAGVFPGAAVYTLPTMGITSDGGTVNRGDWELGIERQPSSSSLPAPTSVDVSDNRAFLAATYSFSAGALIDSVSAYAEWTDADGIACTEPLSTALIQNTSRGKKYKATMVAPPQNKNINIYFTVCRSGAFRRTAENTTVTGRDVALVSLNASDSVIIRFASGGISRSTDVRAQIVELASGRTVARHGNLAAEMWTVKGCIVSQSLDSSAAWLDGIAKLRKHQDWIMSEPQGRRRRVAVVGLSVEESIPGKAAEVELTLREVQ